MVSKETAELMKAIAFLRYVKSPVGAFQFGIFGFLDRLFGTAYPCDKTTIKYRIAQGIGVVLSLPFIPLIAVYSFYQHALMGTEVARLGEDFWCRTRVHDVQQLMRE